jgi:large subunit ribosomal protein L7/L12
MSSKIIQITDLVDSLTVMELADLVKGLQEKYGVSAVAAAPVAAAGGAQAAAAPAAEAQTEFKVTLKDAGAQKLQVIKALRSVTQLSLKDAKDKVEAAPVVISEVSPKEEAEKIKKELEAAGAKVELS